MSIQTVTQPAVQHTQAWVTFTYAAFLGSLLLLALGVFYLPVDTWIKGYLGMGIAMLVQSCMTMSKTMRDNHESKRLVNRIEDAKTERLLMGMNGQD